MVSDEDWRSETRHIVFSRLCIEFVSSEIKVFFHFSKENVRMGEGKLMFGRKRREKVCSIG